MGETPIKYPKTDGVPVPHTDQNWRDGKIAHDLSSDIALAEAGDEAAQQRLETQRLIALRQMARKSK
jgi:hypothetical protein